MAWWGSYIEDEHEDAWAPVLGPEEDIVNREVAMSNGQKALRVEYRRWGLEKMTFSVKYGNGRKVLMADNSCFDVGKNPVELAWFVRAIDLMNKELMFREVDRKISDFQRKLKVTMISAFGDRHRMYAAELTYNGQTLRVQDNYWNPLIFQDGWYDPAVLKALIKEAMRIRNEYGWK